MSSAGLERAAEGKLNFEPVCLEWLAMGGTLAMELMDWE